jgi:hypothetical protein
MREEGQGRKRPVRAAAVGQLLWTWSSFASTSILKIAMAVQGLDPKKMFKTDCTFRNKNIKNPPIYRSN